MDMNRQNEEKKVDKKMIGKKFVVVIAGISCIFTTVMLAKDIEVDNHNLSKQEDQKGFETVNEENSITLEEVEVEQSQLGEDILHIEENLSQNTTMQSIQLTLQQVNPDEILLVNRAHMLDESYKVNLKWLKNGRKQVAVEIYDELYRMLNDGSKEGLEFVVASGYRSKQYQQRLWDNSVKEWMSYGMEEEEAIKEVSKSLAYPGASEHATGLAVDIVALDYQYLDDKQHDTKESTWLRENCHKYGFILRYPKGKEEITGISYESWHFRYVGKVVAECIMKNQLTLEEYLELATKG